MWRLIFFGLLASLIVYFIKRKNANNHKQTSNSSQEEAIDPQKSESTVQCTTCAIYLPKSEALSHHGKYYCCEKHMKDS